MFIETDNKQRHISLYICTCVDITQPSLPPTHTPHSHTRPHTYHTHTHAHTHTQSLIKLALGHLTPDQLTQDVLSLVSARSPLARHLSDSAHLEPGHSRPSAEVLRIMNVLSERARYSNQCCYVIITCFKLAVVSTCHVR